MAENSGENSNQMRSHRFFETTAANVSYIDGPGVSLCERPVAERQGFEPWGLVKAQRFSRPPHSTTLAPLLDIFFNENK